MKYLTIFLIALGYVASTASAAEKTAEKPNIVFILADDKCKYSAEKATQSTKNARKQG